MADQPTRRRGLQKLSGRREMLADNQLANQFQQPARSIQAPGTLAAAQSRTARITPNMSLPKQRRMLMRASEPQADTSGRIGLRSSLSGGRLASQMPGIRPQQINENISGLRQQAGMRGGGLSRGRVTDREREAREYLARQVLAERDPSYAVDPKTGQERRYGPHGLTFSELEKVYKYQLEKGKTEFEQAQAVAEFHRDNAKTAAELDIDRRARTSAEERQALDEKKFKFEVAKTQYDVRKYREKEDYDRGQKSLDTRMEAVEKDRRYELDLREQELAEAKFQMETIKTSMRGMSPRERAEVNVVNEDNQDVFGAIVEQQGYEIYDEDGKVNKAGRQFFQTLNGYARTNPDEPIETLVQAALDSTGLVTREERKKNEAIENWVADREAERTADPKAWKKREKEILARAGDIASDIAALEKGDKGRGLLGFDREKGIKVTIEALKEKYDVIEASPEVADMLPAGTYFIAPPTPNNKYPRVLKAGGEEASLYVSGQDVPTLSGEAEAEELVKKGKMKVGDYFRDEKGDLYQIEQE